MRSLRPRPCVQKAPQSFKLEYRPKVVHVVDGAVANAGKVNSQACGECEEVSQGYTNRLVWQYYRNVPARFVAQLVRTWPF